MFDPSCELSDPRIDSKDPYTNKVQKHSKEITKIIHVKSGVLTHFNQLGAPTKYWVHIQ